MASNEIHLSTYGYVLIKSEEERRAALLSASEIHTPLEVLRRLNTLRNFQSRVNERHKLTLDIEFVNELIRKKQTDGKKQEDYAESTHTLCKRNGEKIKVELTSSQGQSLYSSIPSGRIYTITTSTDSTVKIKLGYMATRVNNETDPDPSLEILRLSNATIEEGEHKIRGIGTLLIKKAFDESLRSGCGGRLSIKATYDSHVFYYKLGFRAGKFYDDYFQRMIQHWLYRKLRAKIPLDVVEQKLYDELINLIAEKKKIDKKLLVFIDIFPPEEMNEMELANSKKDSKGCVFYDYGCFTMSLSDKEIMTRITAEEKEVTESETESQN